MKRSVLPVLLVLLCLTGCAISVPTVVRVVTPSPSSTPVIETSTPAPAAAPSATSIPTPVAQSPAPTIAAPAPPSVTAATVAGADAIAKGAAFLQTADDYYRTQFEYGVTVINTPAGVDWWSTVGLGNDVNTSTTAYTSAQAALGDYGSPSMDAWFQGPMLNVNGDIIRWYQAPTPQSQATVEQDLDQADAEIALMQSGQ